MKASDGGCHVAGSQPLAELSNLVLHKCFSTVWPRHRTGTREVLLEFVILVF